jgi:hypothetical protein
MMLHAAAVTAPSPPIIRDTYVYTWPGSGGRQSAIKRATWPGDPDSYVQFVVDGDLVLVDHVTRGPAQPFKPSWKARAKMQSGMSTRARSERRHGQPSPGRGSRRHQARCRGQRAAAGGCWRTR